MVFYQCYHTQTNLLNIGRAPRDMKYYILLLRKLLSAQLNSLGLCTLPISKLQTVVNVYEQLG